MIYDLKPPNWYDDVNLISLEEKYGQLFLNKVYFHIIIFEVSKLVSLHPKTIDLGPYASFAYSNSIYGAADIQHKRIKDLLKHGEQTKQHQLWVFDSFIDSPVLKS